MKSYGFDNILLSFQGKLSTFRHKQTMKICVFTKKSMGRYRSIRYGKGLFIHKTSWVTTNPQHTPKVHPFIKQYGSGTEDPLHMAKNSSFIKYNESLDAQEVQAADLGGIG